MNHKQISGLTIVPSVAEALRRQALQLERILCPTREISRSIEQIRRAVAYPIVEVSQSAEHIRRTIANITQPLAETARWLQNTFPAANLIERWKSIHIITSTPLLSGWVQYPRWVKEHLKPLGERLRLLPFYLAWRALEEGDRKTVNYFLAKWCGMSKPTEDAYLILWHVLQEGHWRRAENPDAYVKAMFWEHYKKRLYERQLFGDKYWKRNKPLAEELVKHGFEAVSLDDLPESGGRLWIPGKDDIQDVEDRLFIEWALGYVQNPSDRKAILAYCRGYAETLREAYGGDKNKQDEARRRLKKLAVQLKPILFS